MVKVLAFVVILVGLHSSALGAPGGRIIGGNEAEPGQFPYMVSLQVKFPDENSFEHSCGGSILSKRTILSAAHCFFERPGMEQRVYVGANKLDGDGIGYEIESFLPHPNFTLFEDNITDIDKVVIQHDIGVLYLKEDLVFSPLVQPIALDPEYILGGENVTTSGWGYYVFDTENVTAIIPNELQYINLRTIDQELCNNLVSDFPLLPHSSHVCFLNKVGEGICSGDSGSPVVKNGKQIGAISWSGKFCAEGIPDGAARISTDYEWIKSVTK